MPGPAFIDPTVTHPLPGQRSTLRPSLSDASRISLLHEESAHRAQAAHRELQEAKQQHADTEQQIRSEFGEHPHHREPSASGVRFHIDDEEVQPVNTSTTTTGDVELVPVTTKQLNNRHQSSMIDLSHIKDSDIRAFLDPSNGSISTSTLLSWSPAKVQSLVDNIRPEHFQRILSHAVRDGTQARADVLTFSRLHYTDAQGNVRLQDVSGYLKPGEVVGIVAAPDAGASTLLDLLSGKAIGGHLEGTILYANRPPSAGNFTSSVGYVDQQDLHLPLLTVEETLFFSARLRLPANIPDDLVRFRVQTVMALVGLSHVKDSLVGNDMVKGISGGQKRRLTSGVELTAGHSVLLADLPTNGLDSATAFDLIRTFHHMVKAGLSMMCTVVQAGPELFALFERIIVMSKGTIIYSGPPDSAEAYFRSIGFFRPSAKSVPQFLEELSAAPEKFYRPDLIAEAGETAAVSFRADAKWHETADTISTQPAEKQKQFFKQPVYSLNVSAPGAGSKADAPLVASAPKLNSERVSAWTRLNEAYRTSIFYAVIRDTLTQFSTAPDNSLSGKSNGTKAAATSSHRTAVSLFGSTNYNATLWIQFRETFLRQARLFHRNRSSWLHIWMQSLIMAFMLGSLFYSDALDTTEVGVRSRVGLYFYLTILLAFNSFVILPVILSQRALFYAQTADRFYRPFMYYASFMVVQTFVLIVDLLILLIPVWGLSGLAGFPLSGGFWFGFLVLLTGTLTARHWIVFISYLVPSEIIATTVLTISFYLFCLLSGEFIAEPVSPAGWKWAFNLSYPFWVIRALVLNDYVDAAYISSSLGYDVGAESKWHSFENTIYFLISFAFAAIMTLSWISWARPAVPSVSDFSSYATTLDEDNAAEVKAQQKLIKHASSQGIVPAGKSATVNGAHSFEGVRDLEQGDVPANVTSNRAAYLDFKNLKYTVTLPNGTDKVLLDNVYGYARPGRLVALMGKSGAGKSTLLDVLAGRKTGGVMSGTIRINGKPKEQLGFAAYAAYVEQFDSHDPLSTVREAVFFSGRMRLSRTLTDEEVNAKVDHVLDLLVLRNVENSIIGFPGFGGISMELRKKLTIAVETIAEPALLFLDEPTTGLDSHSAANVMKAVRSLASTISVICTIHQPPSELVAFFQDVLLIDEGRVTYFGDIADLPPFLHEMGAPKIELGRNVSDYALETISDRNLWGTAAGSTEGEVDVELGSSKSPKRNLSSLFLTSPYAKHLNRLLKTDSMFSEAELKNTNLLVTHHERASFITQTAALTRRFFLTSVRHRDSLQVRYIFAVIFGFFVGTVYSQLQSTQSSGPKHIAVVFFTVGHFLFSASAFFPAIFMNRVLYFRESTTEMYSPHAYFIARILGDVPHILLEVFMPTLMIYFIADLNSDAHSKAYGFFFWCCLIMRFCGIFFTQLVASCIAAPDFAYSVLATIMYLMFALSGFFIPYSNIPIWWKWLTHLDFLKYGLQFLALTEYKDQAWTCDPDSDRMTVIAASQVMDSVCGSSGFQTFPNPADPSGTTLLKCENSCGYELLDSLGITTTVDWQIESFVILHSFALFFALCGYLALRFINHVQR